MQEPPARASENVQNITLWPLWLILIAFLPSRLFDSDQPTLLYFIQSLAILTAAFKSTDKIPFQMRLGAGCLFLLISMAIQLSLPVLAGRDEITFHSLVGASIETLLAETADSFQLDGLPFVRSTYFYPLVVSVLSGEVLHSLPNFILIINGVLTFWMAGQWINIMSLSNRPILKIKEIQSLSFIFLTCSFSIVYWSSVFSKDITAVAASVAAASALLRKRYIYFIVLFLAATFIRNYSISVIVIIYTWAKGWTQIQMLMVAGSAAVLVVGSSFELRTLFNWPLITGYLFLSPNPGKTENWQILSSPEGWQMSPIFFTVEGLFFGSLLLVGILLLLWRPFSYISRELWAILFGLMVAGAVLTLLGHYLVDRSDREYGFFVVGDNMVRKKLIAWPLLATWAAIILQFLLFPGKTRTLARSGDVR